MIHSSEAVYVSGNKLLHFNLISTVGRKRKVEALWCLEKDYWTVFRAGGQHWLHHTTDMYIREGYVYTTQQVCMSKGFWLYHTTDG